jgi:hypothetical protein
VLHAHLQSQPGGAMCKEHRCADRQWRRRRRKGAGKQ